MSTIHFTADELGNVAAWAASRSGMRSEKGALILSPWAESIAAVSRANVANYVSSYGPVGAPAPCSADEIAAAAPSVVQMRPRAASGTVTSLLYNIDQDDARAVLAVATLATMAARA